MTTKNKIITVSSLSLLGIFLIIIFLILPYQQKIITEQNNIAATWLQIYQQQEEAKNIIANNKELKNLDKKQIEAMFIEKNKALEFINTLETLAQKNNCDLSIKLEEPSNKEYTQLTAQFIIISEWTNILSYLKEIEKQDFYLNYQDIQILPTSDTIDNQEQNNLDNKITANISAKTYWR